MIINDKNFTVINLDNGLILCWSYNKLIADYNTKTNIFQIQEENLSQTNLKHLGIFKTWLKNNNYKI